MVPRYRFPQRGYNGLFIIGHVFQTYKVVLLVRIVYGFLPATALFLVLLVPFDRVLSWVSLGVFNLGSIFVMCVAWESKLQLLSRLKTVEFPYYENFIYFVFGAAVFSPYILWKLNVPGTILNKIIIKGPIPEW